MTKPMLEEIDITETQEFKEFQRRNFCCHVSYDDLERWYFRAANELNTLQAELLAAQAVNAKNGAVIAGQEAELAQVKGERDGLKRQIEWADSDEAVPKCNHEALWSLHDGWMERAQKAESRLALAEPLLKAAMELPDPVDLVAIFTAAKDMRPAAVVLSQARVYRNAVEGAKEGEGV